MTQQRFQHSEADHQAATFDWRNWLHSLVQKERSSSPFQPFSWAPWCGWGSFCGETLLTLSLWRWLMRNHWEERLVVEALAKRFLGPERNQLMSNIFHHYFGRVACLVWGNFCRPCFSEEASAPSNRSRRPSSSASTSSSSSVPMGQIFGRGYGQDSQAGVAANNPEVFYIYFSIFARCLVGKDYLHSWPSAATFSRWRAVPSAWDGAEGDSSSRNSTSWASKMILRRCSWPS